MTKKGGPTVSNSPLGFGLEPIDFFRELVHIIFEPVRIVSELVVEAPKGWELDYPVLLEGRIGRVGDANTCHDENHHCMVSIMRIIC